MKTLHTSAARFRTGLLWLFLTSGVLLQTPASAAIPDTGARLSVTDQGDRVRVEVEADHPIPYTVSTSSKPPAVTVDLQGVTQSEGLRREHVDLFPVKDITPTSVDKPVPAVRLQVSLTALVFPEISRDGNRLLLDFSKKQGEPETAGLGSAVGHTPAAQQPVGDQDSNHTAGLTPATTLNKVDVQRRDQDVIVVLRGDGGFRYDVTQVDRQRLVLDLYDVGTAFGARAVPVEHELLKQIRVGRHANKVRLVFDLSRPVHYMLTPSLSQLAVRLVDERTEAGAPAGRLITIDTSAVQHSASSKEQEKEITVPRSLSGDRLPNQGIAIPAALHNAVVGRPEQPRLAQMAPDEKAPAQAEPAEELGQRRYVGRRISMDFQQADISNVLRLIAEVSGFNIVVGENVKSKVTMKLVGVPWDQALDMLLKMNNLGMIREGNIVWIDSLSNLSRQQDEEAKAKESKSKAEDLVTEVIYIRNLQAQEVQTTLRPYLTPRGQLNVSAGSNLLVIRDTPSNVAIFRKLVEGLDLEVPQVQIESRIVQADTTYIRSLGIQWGYANLNTLASGKVVNLRGQGGGGSAAVQDAFGSQTSQFLVNLPATVTGLSSVPAVGLTFGLAPDVLDLRLSAGELLNLAKVIAAPKIITLDKREARIEQGESIPFQTISLQGTQTTFVDANLTLQVTPQITSRDPKETSKQILLRVRATRNAVGTRSNPAGPSIDKREATTQVLVRDGETMVIGGIFVDNQTNFSQGVPWLSRIPVIGWFFKSKTESINKQELLIFLTPTIIKT
jgi:type IV pilus assembly protein PilQ